MDPARFTYDVYIPKTCAGCGIESDQTSMIGVGDGHAHFNCVLRALVRIAGADVVLEHLREIREGL